MAACQGGRLVVHFTNRKNAPLLFFHTNRDATPHVLVSDLAMSGHDGLWLIREVRRLGGLDGLRVPAIAVSGQMSKRQALAEGFDAYFTKPIDPDALFGAVGSAVRRTA